MLSPDEGENEDGREVTLPVPGARFGDTLESASPDLLREMIRGFAQRTMDAEVEGVCGAGYGEVSSGRVNSRNGYRHREWDTRAGPLSWRSRSGRAPRLKAAGMPRPSRDVRHL